MLKAPIKALSFIAIAVFIFSVMKPAVAEDFSYRGPKLNPESSSSALFLTPMRKLDRNTFTLDLVVDPSGEEINTVSTEISFPADKLSLIDLSKANSFCSFFVEEKINNDLGKIKLSCVAPFPGTETMSNVITLTFKQTDTGYARLDLSQDSMVLANDGYGTNVLKSLGGQTVESDSL
jgi:hypothetical protein